MPILPRTRLGRIIAVVGGALCILGALAFDRTYVLVTGQQWIAHSYLVQASMATFDGQLTAVEAIGQGNGPGTGVVVAAHADSLERTLDTLRALTADNDRQQRRLGAIDALVRHYLSELGSAMAARDGDRTGASAGARAAGVARADRTLVAIRALTTRMGRDEQDLLRVRLAGARRATEWVMIAVAALITFGLTIVMIALGRLANENRLHRAALVALEESEQRYRSIVSDIQDIIFQTDPRGRWTFLNPAWTHTMGYTVEETLGRGDLEFIYPDDAPAVARELATITAGKSEEYRHDVRFITRSGELRWMEVHARAIRAEDGTLLGAAGTLSNITARRQLEERQRRDDERMRQIVEHMPIGVAMFDTDMHYILTSRQWRSEYGLIGRDVIGNCHYDLVPDVPAETRALHARCIAGQIERRAEEAVVRPDGRTDWIRWEVRPWRDHLGMIGGIIIFTETITDRKLAEHERLQLLEAQAARALVEANEARYRTLAEALPQIVWTARPDGWLDYYNQRWYDYSGLTLDDTQGWGWATVLHPDDRERCVERWRDSAATGTVFEVECRFRRASDESYRWHLGRAVPIRDAEQRIVKWIGTYADIDDQKVAEHALRTSRTELEQLVAARTAEISQTVSVLTMEIAERERAEEALREAKEAAEAASKAKSDFLAGMSHELRTPLNSVIGFANVLLKNRQGALREQELSYIGRIASNGKHLLALINDILDLSKIEAGRTVLTLAPVAVDALAYETVAQLEGSRPRREVRMVAEVPPAVALIDADAQRLRQVLINLMGNALKFTERGSVTVRVLVHPETHAPVRIDVADTGIGIPRDRQDAIFEAFEQADSGTTRRYGGTGLGLTISRSLCQFMGYRLDLASEPGVGSTFSIVLDESASFPAPLPLPAPADTPEPAAPLPAAVRRRHPLALVVDDDADSRVLLSHALEEYGCRVIAAASAAEGLRLARERQPQLITLDLLMPNMNGCQMLDQLRADRTISRIPVIVVSIVATEHAASLPPEVERLDKPISRDDLFAALDRTLVRKRGRVLVVEHDESAAEMLTACLRRSNVEELHLTRSARGALERLEVAMPDLLVIDLHLPAEGNRSLVEIIRADLRFRALPIVVVNAAAPGDAELRRLEQQVTQVLDGGTLDASTAPGAVA